MNRDPLGFSQFIWDMTAPAEERDRRTNRALREALDHEGEPTDAHVEAIWEALDPMPEESR